MPLKLFKGTRAAKNEVPVTREGSFSFDEIIERSVRRYTSLQIVVFTSWLWDR